MDTANQVLSGIARNVREITTLMTVGSENKHVCLSKVDACISHLNTIRDSADAGHFAEVEDNLRALRSELMVTTNEGGQTAQQIAPICYSAERPKTGHRGRPSVEITVQQLRFLQNKGCTAAQIAKQLGCSTSLIYKRLSSENLHMRAKYTDITDAELDHNIQELHQNHHSAGNEMMSGYLRASGLHIQRQRIRQSLRRVDQLGSAERWSRAVTRRTYSVPTPNSLWHLDSHMKLVRWGFVTHGCIDGYSRVITFLNTSTTNEAKAVLKLFVQACIAFGVPSRVRCDHGGENMDVAIFMTLIQGADRASVLAGRSVHNQRIERLWKDVATEVTQYFYRLFYELEDEGTLDASCDLHLYALHVTALPMINARMQEFRHGWNSHRMRTAGNRSPEQIWVEGMLKNANSRHTATTEVFSQAMSLDVRVEESLRHFNLNTEPFTPTTGLEPSTSTFTVDTTTAARIQTAIAGSNDLKVMYKTALQILQHHVST